MPNKKDLSDLKNLSSRLKMRSLTARALGQLFLAARYARAAYELELNLVERACLGLDAALLEFEGLERGRPDQFLQLGYAKDKLLEQHGLKRVKRRKAK